MYSKLPNYRTILLTDYTQELYIKIEKENELTRLQDIDQVMLQR